MRNQMEPPCVQRRPRKTSSRATSLGGKHLDAAIPDVTQESLFQLQNSQVWGLCTSGSWRSRVSCSHSFGGEYFDAPACQESEALRSTQGAASVYAAPPCAAAEEEVNTVWWRAGHHRNNNHTHGRQRTWWVCVANREAFIKWIPSGAWMRADGVHLSLRINRKEEVRHLKVAIWKQTAETERFQLNDSQHTFLWLTLMLTVWPRSIHGQWTLSGTFVSIQQWDEHPALSPFCK